MIKKENCKRCEGCYGVVEPGQNIRQLSSW